MTRIEKCSDLLNLVRICIEGGRYLDTRHATERRAERQITRPEVLFVLMHGYHEKKKDRFDEFHQSWSYAVRGRTVDRRKVRVIVSFDANRMLVITAIELK